MISADKKDRYAMMFTYRVNENRDVSSSLVTPLKPGKDSTHQLVVV